VRIIARGTLTGFVQMRVDRKLQTSVKAHLDTWYAQISKAAWQNSSELKQQFRSASIVTSERVVFNIRGNDYRLIAAINYQFQILLILWLGTHREYDQIDVTRVEYDKRRYHDLSNPH
jgi:mRNA interferase HigB